MRLTEQVQTVSPRVLGFVLLGVVLAVRDVLVVAQEVVLDVADAVTIAQADAGQPALRDVQTCAEIHVQYLVAVLAQMRV